MSRPCLLPAGHTHCRSDCPVGWSARKRRRPSLAERRTHCRTGRRPGSRGRTLSSASGQRGRAARAAAERMMTQAFTIGGSWLGTLPRPTRTSNATPVPRPQRRLGSRGGRGSGGVWCRGAGPAPLRRKAWRVDLSPQLTGTLRTPRPRSGWTAESAGAGRVAGAPPGRFPCCQSPGAWWPARPSPTRPPRGGRPRRRQDREASSDQIDQRVTSPDWPARSCPAQRRATRAVQGVVSGEGSSPASRLPINAAASCSVIPTSRSARVPPAA